jgi:D-alanyl-lipoteichoic acid acyltransferase DltB (MBOAT superfamily)
MLFNSLQFAVFFAVVYGLYLVLDHRRQNWLLLAASVVFYGSWDWRFLFLLLASTALNYLLGLAIDRASDRKRRRLLLIVSVCGNLSILGFFKYCNFFAQNLVLLIDRMGFSVSPPVLNVVLPLGISFYTFQAMSYTIDIYYGRLKPAKSYLDVTLFVIFFPQLVAGPIERATHLLPQMLSPRRVTLDKFHEGAYLILWGLFQKVFVADNLARIADPVFAAPPPYRGAEVLVGVYAFAFQIFCDFAGYSNIARGLGKCMGFDIMVNFRLPYFSTNPREFWQRWHISLSNWLRDYLYIPLGGNRNGTLKTYRNLAITMLLGGLWHGAAWTFVFWGAYHGALLIGHRLIEGLRGTAAPGKGGAGSGAWRAVKVVFFFHLICVSWILFRARSLTQAYGMFVSLAANFDIAGSPGLWRTVLSTVLLLWLLLLVQCFQYRKDDLMAVFRWPPLARGVYYFILYYSLVVYGVQGAYEFIYFQF